MSEAKEVPRDLLLAGESPCLPPHAGEGAALALPDGVALTAVVGLLVLWGVWRLTVDPEPEPPPESSPSATFAPEAPAPEAHEPPPASADRD